jgi:uncharacterized protein
MRARLLAAALCLVAAPAAAQEGPKASFDCKKAATPVERAICQGNYTAELDRAMDTLYRAALERAPAQRATTEAAQRQWLALRNSRCGRAKPDTECLAGLYKDRIIALVRLTRDAESAPITGRYAYREQGQAGEMFIAEMPDGTTLVLVETVNVGHPSPHTCSLMDYVKDRRGAVLSYRDPEASKTCGLEIAVTGNRAVMRETPKDWFEAAQYNCGAHGYMLGNYARR